MLLAAPCLPARARGVHYVDALLMAKSGAVASACRRQ
jgi:hypothetical protein